MERNVNEDRSLLKLVLLSAITCGIYGIIFYWDMVKDLNTVCNHKGLREHESPNYLLVLLFSFITCGTYGIYWIYIQGNRMNKAGKKYQVAVDETGLVYLVWFLISLFTLGFASLVISYLMIHNMNKLCMAYMSEREGRGGFRQPDDQKRIESVLHQDEGERKFTVSLKSGAIVGVSGIYAGTSIEMKDEDCITIGRDGTVSNLVLDEQAVSRKHCKVRYSAPEHAYYVTDLSTNGTSLGNGQKLMRQVETRVTPGTKLILGNSQQIFLLK